MKPQNQSPQHSSELNLPSPCQKSFKGTSKSSQHLAHCNISRRLPNLPQSTSDQSSEPPHQLPPPRHTHNNRHLLIITLNLSPIPYRFTPIEPFTASGRPAVHLITPTILLNRRSALRTLTRLSGFPILTGLVLLVDGVLDAALSFVPGDGVKDAVGVVTRAAFAFVAEGWGDYGTGWAVEFAAFAKGV